MTEEKGADQQSTDQQVSDQQSPDQQTAQQQFAGQLSADHRRRKGLLVALAVIAIVVAGAIVFGVVQMTSGDDSEAPPPDGTSEPADSDTSGSSGDGADGNSGDADDSTGDDVKPSTNQVLPEAKGGQEAIDALGDKMGIVAQRNDMTVEELEEFLLSNPSAKVAPNGSIFTP